MKENKIDPSEELGKSALTPSKMRKVTHSTMIVDLFLKGLSQTNIRAEMQARTGHTYSVAFVGKAVKEAMKDWDDTKTDIIANHKAFELAKINNLELVYWEAWERSTGIIVSTSKVKRRSNSDRLDKRSKLALVEDKEDGKTTAGDPRFLTGIQWCIDKRCEILGIDAPMPTPPQQSGNTQNNITINNRKVIFLTREMTAAPQTMLNENV